MSITRIEKYPMWDLTDAENLHYLHTVIFVIQADEVFRLTRSERLPGDPTGEELETVTPIPKDHLWPKPQKNAKEFTGALSPEIYVKRPGLGNYDTLLSHGVKPSDLMLQEIATLEKFTHDRHHPHVAPYLGYLKGDDGLIKGLCFPRYRETLDQRLCREDQIGSDALDVERCMRHIRSGVKYLHQQGFVHNDINVDNIMFDDDGKAIIIDFDSCQQHGAKLGIKPGVDLEAKVADYDNDERALSKLGRTIRDRIEGQSE